ncbi:MAG: hypothetical protein K2X54_08315 [Methylobacterium organophilum]|nr:hypothetical protein [Methylobacterium organophilum]
MLAAIVAFLRSLVCRDAPAPEPAPPPAPKRSFMDDIDPEEITLGALVIQHARRRLARIHGQPLPVMPAPLPSEIEVWLAAKGRDGLIAVAGCVDWEIGPHVCKPAGVRGPCEARVGPVRRLAPPPPKASGVKGEDDGKQGRSGKGGPGGQTPHEVFMETLRASMEPSPGMRMR